MKKGRNFKTIFPIWTCCETFETKFGERSEHSYKELMTLKGVKENIKLEILLKEKDSTTWLNPRPRRVKKRTSVPQTEALTGSFFKILVPIRG